jgi:hypothetical protein
MFIQSVNVSNTYSPTNIYTTSDRGLVSKLSNDSTLIVKDDQDQVIFGYPQVETPNLLKNKRIGAGSRLKNETI